MPFLLYDDKIEYSDDIELYPVTMADVLNFNLFSLSIKLRKDSTFRDKNIIKMSYLEFLIYSFNNKELEQQYGIVGLSNYYMYAIQLLHLCCRDAEIKINQQNKNIYINDQLITSEVFDDLRRIIIIQNGIDFDIDEFLNFDTEQSLIKAKKHLTKDESEAGMEDYIDSLAICMNVTPDVIKKMSIRKFWRYINRYRLREEYTINRTGESSGFVTFKEPIKQWIRSIDNDDKYASVKADEDAIKGKINNANG